jgi:hypothetical protein
MRSHLTASEKVKNVMMPFNGLYNSILGTELDSAIENDGSEFDYSKYNSDYNQTLTNGYNLHLITLLNEQYKTDIKASGSDYEKMNLQNRGDNLWLDVDVDTLPSIDTASACIGLSVDEIWQELQTIASERLTSCSGFISFYDPNINNLKGADFKNWDSVYISIYIAVLSQNLDCVYKKEDSFVSDIEQDYLESLSGNGGAIELLLGIMTSEDIELYNESCNN